MPGLKDAVEAAGTLTIPEGVTMEMIEAGMREWDAAHTAGERQWPNMLGRVFIAMRDAAAHTAS